jgi:hypothetical protein
LFFSENKNRRPDFHLDGGGLHTQQSYPDDLSGCFFFSSVASGKW